MPTVRQRQLSNVSTPSIPSSLNPGPGLDSGGQALAQGISNLGSDLQNIALKKQQDANQIKINDALYKMEKYRNASLYGPDDDDDDFEDGYIPVLNRVGEQALGSSQDAIDKYRQKYDAVLSTLGNEAQRQAFIDRERLSQVKYLSNTERHESAQIRVYDKQVTDARVSEFQKTAENNFLDKKEIFDSYLGMTQSIEGWAERNGITPYDAEGKENPIFAAMMNEAATKFHKGVLNRMIGAKQWELADQYLKTEADDIDGDITAMQNAIKDGMVYQAAQDEVDVIRAQKPDDYNAQLKAARAEKDRDKREQMLKIIDQERTRDEAAEREARFDLGQQLMTQIDQGQEVGLSNLTLDQRELLGPEGIAEIQDYQQKKNNGHPMTTDSAEYTRLVRLSQENPAALIQENPLSWRKHLSDVDYKRMLGIRGDLAGSGRSDEAESLYTLSQTTDEYIRSGLNLSPNAKGSDGIKVNNFRNRAAAALNHYQKVNGAGKVPSEPEWRQMMAALAIEVELPGGLFNDEAQVFELAPGTQVEVDYDDIEPVIRNQIYESIKRKLNREPSPKEIIQVYMQYTGLVVNLENNKEPTQTRRGSR